MNTTNPYDILNSFRKCPGLAHYFFKSRIDTLNNETWIVQGKQEEESYFATVTATNYGCVKAELAIKWLDCPPTLMGAVLPMLESIEQVSNGVLKLIGSSKPGQFILIFITFLPVGYNEYHLDMLAKELQAISFNCQKIDEIIDMATNSSEMISFMKQPQSGGKGNIWDSIANLDKKPPAKKDPSTSKPEFTEGDIEELPELEEFEIEDFLNELEDKGNNEDEDEPNDESNT